MKARAPVGFAVLLALSVAVRAQEGQVPYIETLEVRVHNIDVIVTDAKGKPVTGLRQEDFELREGGAPQPITNFSEFLATATDPGSADAAAAASRPEPRKFILYVDEMSLVQSNQKAMKRQLDRLLVEAMRPGDEAMVLLSGDQQRLLMGFTTDREAVRKRLAQTIDQQNWRATSPIHADLNLLEISMRGVKSQREARLIARRYAGIVRRRVQHRLGNLNSAVTAAAELPGRKVMIVAMESLPAEPGREAFRSYHDPYTWVASDSDDASFGSWISAQPDAVNPDFANVDWTDLSPLLGEIARTAATGGITIYTVQAEYGIGMASGSLGVETRGQPRAQRVTAPPTGGQGSRMLDDMVSNTETTMRILAEKTGGTWYRGGGRIDDAVRQIVSDVGSYYSLGYRAGEQRDTAQRIDVRIKGRPELRVRARTEVIRKSPEREMTDRVVAALVATAANTEVPVTIELEPGKGAVDRAYRVVNAHLVVPLSALTFLPEGNDKYRARVTVHYAVTGESSDFVSGMQGPQIIDVPAAELQSATGKTWRYTIPLRMRPGPHQIAIGVLDSVSHLSGVGTTAMQVTRD